MRIMICTLLFLLPIAVFAQTPTQITIGPDTHPIPITGFNLNSLTKPSWQNESFTDSVRALHPTVIRYPGGTTSQYWDWKNGKVWPLSYWQNGTFQNHQNLGQATSVPHKLEDFKMAIDMLEAEPLFVLNVLSDDLESQMDFLRHANQIGLSVNWIELGNEMYFLEQDFINRYPLPEDYANEMLVWIDSIQSEFPDARIAAIGASESPFTPSGDNTPARIQFWNDAMLDILPDGINLTFHRYYRHGNNASGVEIGRTLAHAFSGYRDEEKYTVDSLPQGRNAWWTEYNLTDNLTGNHMVATSWLHGLFTGILHLNKLSNPKNEMIIMHQITGKEPFGALDSYFIDGDTIQNHITPLGKAMGLIHQAEYNATLAHPLQFSTNPNQSWNATDYPSLMGWAFQGDDIQQFIILNCSPQAFDLNVSEVSDENFHYEQIHSSAPTSLDPTSNHIVSIQGNTTGSIMSPAYSLTLIDLNPTITSLDNTQMSGIEYTIYPNPSHSDLNLDFKKIFNGNISIIDLNGQLLYHETLSDKNSHSIHIHHFPRGHHFVKIKNTAGVSSIIPVIFK